MSNLYVIPKGEIVSYAAAVEYENNIFTMVKAVNLIMDELNLAKNLIGDNPLSMMHDNHFNHANFMVTVFKLNDYELLKKTLNWVLNSYKAKGFKLEYFYLEMEAWIKVVDETLEPNYSSEIIKVHEWIKSVLGYIEAENEESLNEIDYPFDIKWEKSKNEFFNFLINGNSAEALKFSKSMVKDRESLQSFYDKIVTYSMYEVGLMWEKGLISVAQEHLATSIVMRIMSYLYVNFILIENTKGKAIITASVNEHHEVGARIVADFLELDGWDVKYLGANTPNDELIKIIKEEKPLFIGIAVTLAFNIIQVKELISKIRSDSQISPDLKILVGGYAFLIGTNNSKKIGADKISVSSYEVIETARRWWKENNESKFK